MRTHLYGALLVLVLLSLSSSAAVLAEEPGAPAPAVAEPEDVAESPAQLISETWDRSHVQGEHSGYVHTQLYEVERPGGDLLRTDVHTKITLNRLGTAMVIESDVRTWERPDGQLVRIESESSMGGAPTQATYAFVGGNVAIEKTAGGQVNKMERAVPADLVGPQAILRRTKALAGKSEGPLVLSMFVTDFDAALPLTLTPTGDHPVKGYDGEMRTLTRLESRMTGLPMVGQSWIDAYGVTQQAHFVMSGLTFETYRVADQAAATPGAAASAASLPDVFAATLIREPGPVPVPRHLRAATIRVRAREGSTVTWPEDLGPSLTVELLESGDRLIKARRLVPPEGKTGVRPLTNPPAELASSLAANTMIQADAEEIQRIAREVVGEEQDAWKAAQRLERWVAGFITNKGMGVGFASALEVCKTKEGDCSEHAVLLAALCRAAGIPARVVMGLEYLYGVWGGHAWNEVWISGTWYALDATNGFGFVDPLHLPLARMTLADGDFATEFAGLLGTLGNVDVDVVDAVLSDGRTLALNDASMVAADATSYTNRAWGLHFTLPPSASEVPPSEDGFQTFLARYDLPIKPMNGLVRVTVAAFDAPPTAGWAALATTYAFDLSTASKVLVDGREGRTFDAARGNRTVHRTMVPVGDAVFAFEVDPGRGSASPGALRDLLKTVDFDVR